MPRPAIGLDFGTTNSAIAVVGPDGEPRLARFESDVGATHTFRSVLYFDRSDENAAVAVHAGPGAIERYLQCEEDPGRLVQSLKSFLASRLFSETSVFGRPWRLEQLIGELLGVLREHAESFFGEPLEHAVVGRPVHFVHASNPDHEALALKRLRASLFNAGFKQVDFEYEPVGAAYHYESGLEHDELILIGDFGGGTSDFSLLRVGPSHTGCARRADSILGHDGVGVAGDAFDGKIIRHRVAPKLGYGAEFRSLFGNVLPVPKWIYGHLERWHHVSFLKSRRNMQLLLDLRRQAVEPEKLDALIRVVENDLGFHLYRATERAKRVLSEQTEARFQLEIEELELDDRIERAEFETWIEEELDAIRASVERLLNSAGLGVAEVDRVFLTGGSSFVPAVRQIFCDRFGEEKIRGGAELTSVANGLALRAAETGR